MFGVAPLLSSWIVFNLDKIDISLKQTVTLTDLLYNKIGLLFIFFLVGISTMFLVDHFGIKSISNVQETEYIKWFVSLSLVIANSIFYRSVFAIWKALSQNLMFDTIIDNNIFVIKRLWTRENIIESINSKINLLNESAKTSIKFVNEDYEFVLSNSSGMEEALKLSEEVYRNKLSPFLVCC